MAAMINAQLLTAGCTIYSPWFPRGGDSMIATIDVVAINAAQIVVKVFTKSIDDTGDGHNANTSVSISRTGTGRAPAEWLSTPSTGLQELVRYEFTVTEDFVPGGDVAWVLFRMLTPVWFDVVAA